jgi:hypothetical protein
MHAAAVNPSSSWPASVGSPQQRGCISCTTNPMCVCVHHYASCHTTTTRASAAPPTAACKCQQASSALPSSAAQYCSTVLHHSSGDCTAGRTQWGCHACACISRRPPHGMQPMITHLITHLITHSQHTSDSACTTCTWHTRCYGHGVSFQHSTPPSMPPTKLLPLLQRASPSTQPPPHTPPPPRTSRPPQWSPYLMCHLS